MTEDLIAMARWRVIPSYPEYEVSDCGLVKRKNKLLSQSLNVSGYPRVTMTVNRISVTRVVHCLVAEAFIGPRPDGMIIRHLDGEKTNRAATNLAYGTHKENEADKSTHGRKPFGEKNGANTKPEARPRGSKHGRACFDEADILYIKTQLANCGRGIGLRLAMEFGVHPTTIAKINRGQTWGHV